MLPTTPQVLFRDALVMLFLMTMHSQGQQLSTSNGGTTSSVSKDTSATRIAKSVLTSGKDELGNNYQQVEFPGYFAARVSDGATQYQALLPLAYASGWYR